MSRSTRRRSNCSCSARGVEHSAPVGGGERPATFAEVFAEIDSDHSGEITWSEFVDYFRPARRRRKARAGGALLAGDDRNPATAAVAAAARHEEEQRGRWRGFAWASGLSDADVEELQDTFDLFDLNGDGEVSLQEIRAACWELDGAAPGPES